MKFQNQQMKYGLLFLLLPIILQLLGFIDVSVLSMLSFAAFFIGLTIFYYSFGTNNSFAIFFGSGIFFTGVFSFLIPSFLLEITFPLLLTAAIYITGFSFLMVFIENPKSRVILYTAGFFLLSATMISLLVGKLQFRSLFTSIPQVLKEYWLLLVMAVITVLLLYFEQQQSKK